MKNTENVDVVSSVYTKFGRSPSDNAHYRIFVIMISAFLNDTTAQCKVAIFKVPNFFRTLFPF